MNNWANIEETVSKYSMGLCTLENLFSHLMGYFLVIFGHEIRKNLVYQYLLDHPCITANKIRKLSCFMEYQVLLPLVLVVSFMYGQYVAIIKYQIEWLRPKTCNILKGVQDIMQLLVIGSFKLLCLSPIIEVVLWWTDTRSWHIARIRFQSYGLFPGHPLEGPLNSRLLWSLPVKVENLYHQS